MMQRQLERAGYRVTIYTSSVAALDAFQRQPSAFDLLTTDNKEAEIVVGQRVPFRFPAGATQLEVVRIAYE